MLPTVLVMSGDSWGPVAGFPRALWNLLKIVTIFTIAHSLTLLLAALGILDVPSRLVESVIALSIILVALNNITGKSARQGRCWRSSGSGLFHGLGFATVMGHLPFRTVYLLRSVLGFNIGVELGTDGDRRRALPRAVPAPQARRSTCRWSSRGARS